MDNETLASLLRGRNRAGQPVDATANIIGPAMSALGNTIYGAGRGALTAMAGLPGDINQLITDNLGTLVNAQGLPTTKDIQDFLPLKPTSYEGKLAQKLGEFVPVNPTPIAKGAVAIAKPVGKAMGEQAYRMTEDMLQKQGMMPSIVAYHGTPHNIEGAFDISKVGTGEGAQAYGHGMYYAENPNVASGYAKTLGQRQAGYEINGVRITPKRGSIEDMAVNLATGASGINAKNPFEYAKNKALGLVKQNPQMEEVAKKIEELQSLGANLKTSGNLYKVDIPDKDIPNMLDWDKPIVEQKNLMNLLKKDAKKDSWVRDFLEMDLKDDPTLKGADLYDKLRYKYNENQAEASKYLENQGIKGIRYLDEGSRNATGGEIIDTFKTPDGWKSKIRVSGRAGTDASGNPISSFTTSMPFKTAEEAKNWAETKISGGTSNFVVFDPKEVKILEKNSKPVSRKDIIEEQVNNLK